VDLQKVVDGRIRKIQSDMITSVIFVVVVVEKIGGSIVIETP
jgi:hypothetical protein